MSTEENRFIFPIVPGPVPTRTQQPETGRSTVQFVFKNGEDFVMMDDVTYELIEISKAQVGSSSKFLKEGLDGIILTYLAGFLLDVDVPAMVELQVMQVIANIDAYRGEQTATAVLETGAELTVPSTVEPDQIVRVNTKIGTFAGVVGQHEGNEL